MIKPVMAVLAAAVLYSLPALAANPPAGSYQKTCSNIGFDGTTLTASCRTMGGQMVQTSLQFPQSCIGDVGNINGILACTGPSGSYALTCKGMAVSGTTLAGQCQKRDGSWIPASLSNFQGFQGDITNCNGTLQNGGTCTQ
ncbi:MAG: CVNH domain-containing protein [Pseudomonadota bacterium]